MEWTWQSMKIMRKQKAERSFGGRESRSSRSATTANIVPRCQVIIWREIRGITFIFYNMSSRKVFFRTYVVRPTSFIPWFELVIKNKLISWGATVGSLLLLKVPETLRYWSSLSLFQVSQRNDRTTCPINVRKDEAGSFDLTIRIRSSWSVRWRRLSASQMKGNLKCLFNRSIWKKDGDALSGFCSLYV